MLLNSQLKCTCTYQGPRPGYGQLQPWPDHFLVDYDFSIFCWVIFFLFNKLRFTIKIVSKCIRIASTDILRLKIYLGRGGGGGGGGQEKNPLSCSQPLAHAFGTQ